MEKRSSTGVAVESRMRTIAVVGLVGTIAVVVLNSVASFSLPEASLVSVARADSFTDRRITFKFKKLGVLNPAEVVFSDVEKQKHFVASQKSSSITVLSVGTKSNLAVQKRVQLPTRYQFGSMSSDGKVLYILGASIGSALRRRAKFGRSNGVVPDSNTTAPTEVSAKFNPSPTDISGRDSFADQLIPFIRLSLESESYEWVLMLRRPTISAIGTLDKQKVAIADSARPSVEILQADRLFGTDRVLSEQEGKQLSDALEGKTNADLSENSIVSSIGTILQELARLRVEKRNSVRFDLEGGNASSLSAHPNGKWLVVASASRPNLVVYDSSNGAVIDRSLDVASAFGEGPIIDHKIMTSSEDADRKLYSLVYDDVSFRIISFSISDSSPVFETLSSFRSSTVSGSPLTVNPTANTTFSVNKSGLYIGVRVFDRSAIEILKLTKGGFESLGRAPIEMKNVFFPRSDNRFIAVSGANGYIYYGAMSAALSINRPESYSELELVKKAQRMIQNFLSCYDDKFVGFGEIDGIIGPSTAKYIRIAAAEILGADSAAANGKIPNIDVVKSLIKWHNSAADDLCERRLKIGDGSVALSGLPLTNCLNRPNWKILPTIDKKGRGKGTSISFLLYCESRKKPLPVQLDSYKLGGNGLEWVMTRYATCGYINRKLKGINLRTCKEND